jgi:uncharacterized protein (DUF927 family)
MPGKYQMRRENHSLGYREISQQNGETTEIYYIVKKGFNEESCKGINKKPVGKILKDRRILILDSEGKNPKCPYAKK